MISELASAIGKGLFAGVVGTAAMTLSSTLEIKIADRGPSDTPAKAAGKVFGVQPRDPQGKQRFSQAVHWGYGTAWGSARGLLSAAGLRAPLATTAHFLIVWGAAQVMLPALKVAPPATQWEPTQIATDLLHHAVYAAATGAAYEYIDSH